MNDKIKGLLSNDWLYLSLLLVTIALTSFGLGRLAERSSQAPEAAVVASEVVVVESQEAIDPEQSVVVSKKGSKYHLPWCPGAEQMNPENKVTFNTIAEAEAAGYTPAANCKGL